MMKHTAKKINEILKIFINILLSMILTLIIIILIIISFGIGIKVGLQVKEREVSHCVWKDKKTIYCRTEQTDNSFPNKR